MKKVSCGVLLLDVEKETILAIKPYGQSNKLDLPKGGINSGETPLQAAVRELREETGVKLQPGQLTDLGPYKYTTQKNLHLFISFQPQAPIDSLMCTSYFENSRGQKVPEAVGFEHVSFDDPRFYDSLKPILRDIKSNYL